MIVQQPELPAHGAKSKRKRERNEKGGAFSENMEDDEAKDVVDVNQQPEQAQGVGSKREKERYEEGGALGVNMVGEVDMDEKVDEGAPNEIEGTVTRLQFNPTRVGLCAVDAALVRDAAGNLHLEDRFECQDVALDNPGETDDLDIILILVPVRAHACSFFSFDGSLKEWKETVNGWKNVHVVMIPQSSNAEDFHKTTKTLTNIWGERWNWLIYHKFPSLTHCYLLNSAIDEPSPENNASTRGGLLQIDGMAELQR